MAERRALKDRVLEAALLHAAFDGWSRRTLAPRRAATPASTRATARRLFPQGGDSLVEWLDDWADRQMLEAAAAEDLSALPVRRRIALAGARTGWSPWATIARPCAGPPVARGLPQQSGSTASRSVWRTVDLIWEAAGLRRRAGRRLQLLHAAAPRWPAVLVGTFLYWLEDASEGSAARPGPSSSGRIEDVMRIGKLRGQLAEMLPVRSRASVPSRSALTRSELGGRQ